MWGGGGGRWGGGGGGEREAGGRRAAPRGRPLSPLCASGRHNVGGHRGSLQALQGRTSWAHDQRKPSWHPRLPAVAALQRCALPPACPSCLPSLQLLSPKVRMLLMRRHATHPFSSGGSSSEYIYSELRSQVGTSPVLLLQLPLSLFQPGRVGIAGGTSECMCVKLQPARRRAYPLAPRAFASLSPFSRLCIHSINPPTSTHHSINQSPPRLQHVGGGFLWLGVPSVIEHNIDERSPLWGMAVEEIQGAGEGDKG